MRVGWVNLHVNGAYSWFHVEEDHEEECGDCYYFHHYPEDYWSEVKQEYEYYLKDYGVYWDPSLTF